MRGGFFKNFGIALLAMVVAQIAANIITYALGIHSELLCGYAAGYAFAGVFYSRQAAA